MKFNVFLFLLLTFISIESSFCQDPEWLRNMKKLMPLDSKRDDVVRVLGSTPTSGDQYSPRYITKDGEFLIRYSTGFCRQNPQSVYDVEEYTVLEIIFFPRKPFKPSKYKINLTGYKVTPSEDVPKAAEYDNDEIGIGYFLTPKGTVEYMMFYIPDKNRNLHCPDK